MKRFLKSVASRFGYEIVNKRAPYLYDENFGYEIIKKKDPGFYYEDGLRTYHTHDFVADKDFVRAYEIAKQASPNPRFHYGRWRVHIALRAAQTALRHGGDFVECGVFQGFMSVCILEYLKWNDVAGDRRFYLVDTFSGLVAEQVTEEEKALGRLEKYREFYDDTFDTARRNVSPYKNVVLVKGIVPDVLPQVTATHVAYLHIDMNCSPPEVAALKYFWPKMEKGGVILFDDYAYLSYETQKEALDRVATEFGIAITSLPTGQGLLIK